MCVCVCQLTSSCRYAAVEEDCDTALALEEGYVKAYLRRGVARRHLGKYSEAIGGIIVACFGTYQVYNSLPVIS